ncbi:acetoacetate--CoA ligase [Mycobacterium sp. CVI_P3]|uniref:Acetoacetate--CoA ligase n=1 Tax=Mycobacterium pinniadriaticum TaxID=2994102 RepID=A0ABT3SEW6_9MYCO|nr:acetoacetate--CoA ligase [Mycobacterium pinniadriaticum]MCX2931549.1 acetoacetate--CoA ligase [Mycobacterium pinniadriaticum]MCX2938059.1 acetoacetate--CoA ligase [Mycobacterium pinniadriaticum]
MPGTQPQWKQFAATTAAQHEAPSGGYAELWQWSVDHPARFWRALWEHFGVVAEVDPAPGEAGVLADASMPGANWFPGVRLNYVDQILRHTDRTGAAIVGIGEDGTRTEIGWAELGGRIGAVAAELRRLGVQTGDCVAGYLPDVADAMVAFLATASIGAVWSACGQDYAPQGAASRLAQLEPKVLFSADGYQLGGRWFDKRADTKELLDLLPDEPHLLVLDGERYRHLIARPAAPEVTVVAFDHPLWVLFSSGTTGKPKGIVHGHGGVILEHLKAAALHGNLGPDDVFFWQTALSWMMWNFRIAGLMCGSTVVCYSGHPLYPDADRLWQLLEDEKVTYFGTSPGHLLASRKAGLHPGASHDLHRLATIGSTGSPLPADLFDWVREEVAEHVAVSSISGGTDVVTAFAGGTAGVPVVPGELTTRYLGVALHSWSPHREPLVGEVGEMVITAPMPSMPVSFWNDEDGSRYRAAYFDHHWADGPAPHVWRHGDWVTVTDRGSLVIHGRSDATLNRHGIRMGSADIYEVVEAIDAVTEGFVLGIDGPDGAYWMPLFVTLAPGRELDDELVGTIRSAIRTKLSPRHVPDEIICAPGIPHTRTGKKLEVPVTAIMAGHTDVSLDPRSIDNPDLIDWYREQGANHSWG